MRERQRLTAQERRILADWNGFKSWLIGVTPPQHRAAAQRALDHLPQRDRRTAKASVLALLPADTDPAVLERIKKPGPADHIVE